MPFIINNLGLVKIMSKDVKLHLFEGYSSNWKKINNLGNSCPLETETKDKNILRYKWNNKYNSILCYTDKSVYEINRLVATLTILRSGVWPTKENEKTS